MPILRPFRALRYDLKAVGDLAAVVAPPYDVISEAYRESLHERSPYNVVRLILNRDADQYGAAATLLRAWRRDGVLVREAEPAFCYYVENFALPDGSTHQREGIIATVRLERFDSGRIRPHERTFARAKEDRMRLLRACATNLSPIFGLFANKEHALQAAREQIGRRAPDMKVRDDAGVRHRLWLLKDVRLIAALNAALADQPIIIADGHHRYETALAYAEERRARGDDDPMAPHNFVMMYLTSMSHPGLIVLPTHRVLAGIPGFDGGDVLTRLRQHLRVTAFSRAASGEFVAHLRQRPRQGRIGIALAGSSELYIASVNDPAVLERYGAHLAPVVRCLDVSVLDTVILRGLMGLDCTAEAQQGRLTYTHDDAAALKAVAAGAQAAFLVNPPSLDDVNAVCRAGETMPEKSTYFYPKLLTGLVFHPFEDDDAVAPTAHVAAAAAPSAD